MAQASEGKVVLITGGRRVGGELALLMAAQGWRIAMTYHTSRATIERTIGSVQDAGTAGLAIPADLAQPDQAENGVNQVIAKFGRIDALVNMASVYRRTPLADLSPSDFDDMIAGNLAAPYHTAVAAARQMLRQPVNRRYQGEDCLDRRLGDRSPLQGLSSLSRREGGPEDDDDGAGQGARPSHPCRHDPAGDDRSSP